ncbi:hypothetical protein GOODEAATRI_024581, partial [Goodea atripinnis]
MCALNKCNLLLFWSDGRMEVKMNRHISDSSVSGGGVLPVSLCSKHRDRIMTLNKRSQIQAAQISFHHREARLSFRERVSRSSMCSMKRSVELDHLIKMNHIYQ